MEKIIKKVTDDEIKDGTFVVPDGVNEIGGRESVPALTAKGRQILLDKAFPYKSVIQE